MSSPNINHEFGFEVTRTFGKVTWKAPRSKFTNRFEIIATYEGVTINGHSDVLTMGDRERIKSVVDSAFTAHKSMIGH